MTEKTTQQPWCPDVCPITGEPFFMWIEHHASGQMVPTYGGPYDSYTIPEKDENGSYCREHYDHDEGGWRLDDIEDVGVQIVSDQLFVTESNPADEQEAHALLQARCFEGYPSASDGIFDYVKTLETKLDNAYEALTAALACADFAGLAEDIVRRGLNNQPQDKNTRLS